MVVGGPSGVHRLDEVLNYLPGNYYAHRYRDGRVLIFGQDSAGWTMEEYVKPRLGSGLIYGHDATMGELVVAREELITDLNEIRYMINELSDRSK